MGRERGRDGRRDRRKTTEGNKEQQERGEKDRLSKRKEIKRERRADRLMKDKGERGGGLKSNKTLSLLALFLSFFLSLFSFLPLRGKASLYCSLGPHVTGGA